MNHYVYRNRDRYLFTRPTIYKRSDIMSYFFENLEQYEIMKMSFVIWKYSLEIKRKTDHNLKLKAVYTYERFLEVYF